MGSFGIIFVLTVLSLSSAEEGCPSPSEISPCMCDGEGVGCMSTPTLEQIRKAFRANFKYGGVQNVYIQGTSITSIPDDLFSNVKAQTFYIEVNKITNVSMKAFAHTKDHITALSFFGNQLTDFSYSSLKEFPELESINLGKNKITSIPSYAFDHERIEVIILAQNKITSIGENAFLRLPLLRALELSFNLLTTLTANSISVEPSLIPWLEINLSGNNISDISNTAFDGSTPQLLELAQNNLTSLKQEVFNSLVESIAEYEGVIDVSGNPLTCKGCDYKWIVNNKFVLNQIFIGFTCPDGTGISALTSLKIGC